MQYATEGGLGLYGHCTTYDRSAVEWLFRRAKSKQSNWADVLQALCSRAAMRPSDNGQVTASPTICLRYCLPSLPHVFSLPVVLALELIERGGKAGFRATVKGPSMYSDSLFFTRGVWPGVELADMTTDQ